MENESRQIKKVTSNTTMLYLLSFAKLIFPLLTLPYLTRVLSQESYGLVSYVKSCMTYMQLIIDFGFILSSVKDIVNAQDDYKRIGEIVGNTILSKFILVIISAIVLTVMSLAISILRSNFLFVILSFIAVALSIFFSDFLFRGIEKMHLITFIFLLSKGVAIILTFIFVKSDSDLLLIPLFDIVMNAISGICSLVLIKKINIPVKITNISACLKMIKDSFIYFLSNIATTAFSALNTLLIGIFISDLTIIAQWSVCLSIITSIQGLYSPICNGIYPYMLREKNLRFIHKILIIFMPIVFIGCLLCFLFAKIGLGIIGGEDYIEAYVLFRCMIPILIFSFPAQLYGWPTLGAIGKVKNTTTSTVVTAILQVIGLILFLIFNCFTPINLAILRSSTEFILMLIRMMFVYKNRNSFQKG